MKKLTLLLALCASPAFGQSLPAFYGAEGGGATSVGGRGGSVCIVNRLADDNNSGSLRYCVNQSGPRTVVFRVGGTIEVKSEMAIWNPYITIAGQTAPGGGIQLTGKALCGDRGWDEMLRVAVDHVIMRYLRFRKGACPEGSGTRRAGPTSVSYSGKNAIFDHLSLAWAEGTTSGAYANIWEGQSKENAPKNITFSNSIFAEPLGTNGWTNFGVGTVPNVDWAMGMTNIDAHNNLLTTFSHRGPSVTLGSSKWVNNIMYNWGWYSGQVGPPSQMDFIGNLWKQGPLGVSDTFPEITVFLYNASSCNQYVNVPPSIYVNGNKAHYYAQNPDSDNWALVHQVTCINGGVVGPLSRQYQRTTPLPATPIPITVRHVNTLENHILPIVGASRRLDCMGNWVYNRDAADTRLINWYQTNQGLRVNHENEVGGIPTIQGDAPCQDTDLDGMPDQWETANGLNPNNAADRNTVHASGYTMLEMYLNGPMTDGLSTLTQPQNVRFSQ